MNYIKPIAFSMLTAISAVSFATQEPVDNFSADIEAIKKQMATTVSNLTVTDVSPSAIEGMYEVSTKNNGILFSSADGTYFLSGELFSTASGKLVNMTEKKLAVERSTILDDIKDYQKIIFPAEGEHKSTITVFTDVDCGYCRKFHKQVPELNAMGIQVDYMAFPRAGEGSETYHKMVSAWCADDQKAAMSALKTGDTIKFATCPNTISEQHKIGSRLGVTGTPAIVLDSGQLIPGYLPAEKISKILDI